MAGFDLGGLMAAASQGENARLLEAAARRAGLGDNEIATAIRALAPALAAGLNREDEDGNTGRLVETIENAGETQELDDLGDPVETGNNILGQLFGSRDVSRAVAADASNRTGLSEDALKQMLPVIAAALVSGLARNQWRENTRSSGLLGGLVGSLGGQSGLAGLAGQFLGGGRTAPEDEPGLTDDILRLISRR